MIVDYDKNTEISEVKRLASLRDSVQRALDEISSQLAEINKQIEELKKG